MSPLPGHEYPVMVASSTPCIAVDHDPDNADVVPSSQASVYKYIEFDAQCVRVYLAKRSSGLTFGVESDSPSQLRNKQKST